MLIREKRRSLSDSQQVKAAEGLLKQLRAIPTFADAKTVGMYLVNDGEIDPAPTMNWCWDQQISTYVPVIQKPEKFLKFAQVTAATEFTINSYGISEPAVKIDELVDVRHLDVVLIPLVAFDSRGSRIGMGGGFYDRTLQSVYEKEGPVPDLIGVAHDIQQVDAVEAEPWDIPLTRVVTDRVVHDFHIQDYFSENNGVHRHTATMAG